MNSNSLTNGDELSLSKALSVVESDRISARRLISSLPEKHSLVVGVTGSPGAGKSTLVDHLSLRFSESAKTAIIAIDPSSPFRGGSLLGDRIRMSRASRSGKVFIRSMASRGLVGGLSPGIYDAVDLLGRCGYGFVIVETVGVGQAETDIVNLSDLVVLVLAPGIGDDIQIMKAGIMEIGDIYVVNKMDMPGAEQLARRVKSILEFAGIEREIVMTGAVEGKNIDKLSDLITGKLNKLKKNGEIENSRKKRTEHAELNAALFAVREAATEGVKLEELIECLQKLREGE